MGDNRLDILETMIWGLYILHFILLITIGCLFGDILEKIS
jgi:hypothetical protein